MELVRHAALCLLPDALTRATHSTRDLGAAAAPGDLLLAELFAPGFAASLGAAQCRLRALEDGAALTLPLRRALDPRTVGSHGAITLRLRGWAPSGDEHLSKRVFLVRHGLSKWNEAQKTRRLDALCAFDHPLTRAGAEQALRLRERWLGWSMEDGGDEEGQWERDFLTAGFVASSPLTRALQTALLALEGHQGVVLGGVTLLRSAREVKGVGSLDSVGKATGEECLKRAHKMLLEELPEHAGHLDSACGAAVHVNDAQAEWWTAADDLDSEADVQERLADLTQRLQFAPGRAAILVGHSLLFRELFRRLASHTLLEEQPQLAQRLQEGKLQNGGCLGLDMQFSRGQARIVRARLLFDSQLVS